MGEDSLLSLGCDGTVLEWELQKFTDTWEAGEPPVARGLAQPPGFEINCMQVLFIGRDTHTCRQHCAYQ